MLADATRGDIIEGRKLGVELICRALRVAPSTYCQSRGRALSAKVASDAVVAPELFVLWGDKFQVHGVRKLWKAARRAGIDIGRDQTARLMRTLGIRGLSRSRRVKTAKPAPTTVRH